MKSLLFSPLVLASAMSLSLVACGSSATDQSHATDDGGPSGETSTTPTACAVGALNPVNEGIVGGTTGLISDGTNLFYGTIPDPRTSSYDAPHYLMGLPVAGGAPTKLATGTSGIALSSLALDGSDLYYVLDKALNKIPKAGGTATKVYAPGGLAAIAMTFAIDDTSIFYWDAGGLAKMNKDGTGATPVFKDDKIRIGAFTVDKDNLYFVGEPPLSFKADAGTPAPSQIYSMPKSGGTPKSLMTISSDPNLEESVWQLSLDGSTLVFSTTTAILKTGVKMQSALYAMSTSGGAVTTLAKLGDIDGPAFAAEGGSVYYGANYGDVMKIAEAGGTPTKLSRTTDGLGAVALDKTNVYYEVRGCIFKNAR